MYSVDQNDRVIELVVPQCSIGAPHPFVISDETRLLLSYLIEQRDPNWDGTNVRIVDPNTAEDPIAVVEFKGYHAYLFGPPNDEAFSGHPLADRGLHPYSAFQVLHSSWIRRLERMNSVHRHHNPKRFEMFGHYVFAFHDSTFECVAQAFSITVHNGPRSKLFPELERLMKW